MVLVPRYSSAFAIAGAVTVALFMLMQVLIQRDEIQLPEVDHIIIELVKPLEMEEVRFTPRRNPKPPSPVEAPPKPPLRIATEDATGVLDVPFDPPSADDRARLPGLSDGAMLPLVKVQPAYPRRALARALEGYTVVEFDVTPQGGVANARVIESMPPGVFDRVSLEAVKRFRYRPSVEDGVALTVTGVQNRFTFELNRE